MIIPKSTAAFTTIFTVIGFVLVVIATCSVPVNENLYLFELTGTTSNETTIARVGVLGLCGDYQGRTSNGQWRNMHDCAKEGLGFRITTTKEVRVSDNGRIVPVEATVAKKEFTRALVFNPLSATFAGIASILGMFMYAIDTSTCLSLCTYIMLAISTGFAWIAFAINIAITLRSRDRVNEFKTSPEQTVNLRIGPTSWISLGSAIALSVAITIWITKHLRTPRNTTPGGTPADRPPYKEEADSQGSIRSMAYLSTPNSSRRQSHA